jgi:hypothetical protein
MPDTEDEAKWGAEFDAAGERQIQDDLFHSAIFPEPKRQFALQWLREQENTRKRREQEMYRYAQWTFWAAVGAVFVGIIGVLAHACTRTRFSI